MLEMAAAAFDAELAGGPFAANVTGVQVRPVCGNLTKFNGDRFEWCIGCGESGYGDCGCDCGKGGGGNIGGCGGPYLPAKCGAGGNNDGGILTAAFAVGDSAATDADDRLQRDDDLCDDEPDVCVALEPDREFDDLLDRSRPPRSPRSPPPLSSMYLDNAIFFITLFSTIFLRSAASTRGKCRKLLIF